MKRPVKNSIQTNGSYLYGEPALWDPNYAHRGIDLAVVYDTVYSASDGTVTFVGYDPGNPAGYEPGGCGNYIFVRTVWDNKYLFILYCHLSLPLVSGNQQISSGQPIAISGNTGYSTGPHLHFELRLNSSSSSAYRNRRNPELWISIDGMGAIYGKVPNAPNNTRVDIYPDPKPRPPYTTFGYALTYNFNDPAIGSDDIYQENYAIGDVKPGTYTITALGGAYQRVVTVGAGNIVNADLSTIIEDDGGIFNGFALAQNYPNPFNAHTRIEFSLAEEALVTLNVFNSLGQEIIKLTEDYYTKGSYTQLFDASDLSSGVYFCRISVKPVYSANTFSDLKKMILLK